MASNGASLQSSKERLAQASVPEKEKQIRPMCRREEEAQRRCLWPALLTRYQTLNDISPHCDELVVTVAQCSARDTHPTHVPIPVLHRRPPQFCSELKKTIPSFVFQSINWCDISEIKETSDKENYN